MSLHKFSRQVDLAPWFCASVLGDKLFIKIFMLSTRKLCVHSDQDTKVYTLWSNLNL